MFDTKWDMCFCEQCLGNSKRVFYRGEPPQKYCLPVGWIRFGLRTREGFAEANKIWDLFHVAFHGTTATNVVAILKGGQMLLKAGDVALGGRSVCEYIRATMMSYTHSHTHMIHIQTAESPRRPHQKVFSAQE